MNNAIQKLGFFLIFRLLWSQRLHLFNQKDIENNIKYDYNLKYKFFIWIYFKM